MGEQVGEWMNLRGYSLPCWYIVWPLFDSICGSLDLSASIVSCSMDLNCPLYCQEGWGFSVFFQKQTAALLRRKLGDVAESGEGRGERRVERGKDCRIDIYHISSHLVPKHHTV